MPINPLIALGVRTPDTAGQVDRFFTRNNEAKEREQRNQLLTRQENRLDRKEQLEIRKAAAALKHQEAALAVRDSARDQLRLKGLLESGQTDRAKEFWAGRLARLSEEGRDFSHSAQLFQMIDADPKGALADIDNELSIARELGVLEKEEGITLSPGQVRFEDGKEVARVAPKSDVKSPEAEAQQIRIANARARANPVNALAAQMAQERLETAKLKREQISQEISQTGRKIAAEEAEQAEENVKQADFLNEGLSIVGDLLTPEGREAVKAASGPIDSRTKTVLPQTRDAEIKIERLKAMLTKDNLGIMTGVLSETDLKIIIALSAGGLDPSGSDAAMIEELERIEDKFTKALAIVDFKTRNPDRKSPSQMTDQELRERLKELDQ